MDRLDSKGGGGDSGKFSMGGKKDDGPVLFEDTGTAQKMDEIRKLLDSKNMKDKLEGMKRAIAMFSKGRNVSSLFPDVVKNVVCPSLEVKKLVHVYLVHYAESEPDLALLSVGTFQKNLQDSNQLIRAMALRVLSSIRVPIISQVVLLACRTCCNDTSAYVRKAAAHAIPKVYSLNPEEEDQLQEMVSTLLGDNSPQVLGSAVQAFQEICPEKWEYIHPNFRKLCNLLVDVDEWGQVIILRLLARYARLHFLDPNPEGKEAGKDTDKPFFSKSGSNSNSGSYSDKDGSADDNYYMNSDHRLMLKCALQLLQSRNSAVVVAVSMLYYHCAPVYESQQCGKALVRTIRNSREKQFIILQNIATMASQRSEMFVNHLKDFFCVAGDPGYIRTLKLEILTQLASEANIATILRELKTYVKSGDIQFVTESIQAVGRCAIRVQEVTDSCMDGLMSLLSSKKEAVVAESVVVIKKLLQLQPPDAHRDVIRHLAKLLDSVAVASARAAIVWVIGEYSEGIPLIAPDVLRQLAKTFCNEDEVTKLQILNLAAKLSLINPDQTSKLLDYILAMAKYDMNYDIRDRARFMRVTLRGEGLFGGEVARRVFLTSKPVPNEISPSVDRARFTIGSMSHIVNHPVEGYVELPDWPAAEPEEATELRDTGKPFAVVSSGFGSAAFGGGSGGFGGGSGGFGGNSGGGNAGGFGKFEAQREAAGGGEDGRKNYENWLSSRDSYDYTPYSYTPYSYPYSDEGERRGSKSRSKSGRGSGTGSYPYSYPPYGSYSYSHSDAGGKDRSDGLDPLAKGTSGGGGANLLDLLG